MFQQFYFNCVNLIFYLNFLTAAVYSRRPMVVTTFKPSTLLLPPGFDSQPVPRQPMLYPYTVAPPVLATRPTIRTIKPITIADWVPLAINAKHDFPPIPPILTSTRPIPLLQERIPPDSQYSSSPSSNDGPVFESIIYGTWKPDPPLQPVKILNDTKMLQYQYQQQQQQRQQQQQHQHQQQEHQSNKGIIDGSIYNNSYGGGLVVNGTFYNKTINRQHGGFIGNIQQKPIKADRQNLQKQNSEKSLQNASSAEYKLKESSEANSELKIRKVKKQGRQKIRPNNQTTEQTAIEKSSAVDSITTTSTAKPMTTKQSLSHQLNVIKVNATDPKIMEVVKQINESAEIKYNHKQTSTHSIDVTVTTETPNTNLDHYGDADEDYSSDKLGVTNTQSDTVSSVYLSTQLQASDDDLENVSATRRSWPTDFMNTPLTTATDEHWNYSESNGASMKNYAPDIPSELSALNIPPSLWPKLPGNITKFGIPYETKSSAEEPALCVPMTVQEQNIMNSKELVFIERIFCFPKPPSTPSEYSSEDRIKTFNPTISTRAATRAKVQNFNDFFDSNMGVTTNCAISNFNNYLNLVMFSVLINFQFIF